MEICKKVELTPEQNEVVLNRGGNLLVAAAAGSGKTKVLIDRIMSRICEEKLDINQFVVITYTRSAAAELRAKITMELSKRLASASGELAKHIQRQLRLIYSAQISTVHSFCGNLLRTHAATAGLPSDFKVIEEQESKVLRASAMEDLLDSVYKNIEKHPDIQAFIDELAYGRDDSAVPAILHNVYDTIQGHPWPAIWAAACLENMDISKYSDAAETPWGRYILGAVKDYVRAQIPTARFALSICDEDAVLAEAYSPAISEDIRHMQAIIASDTWDEAIVNVGKGWSRLKPIRKAAEVSEALQERIKAVRAKYKKNIDARCKNINCPSAEILEDLAKTEASIRGMFELVNAFSERYAAKKEAQNALDFSDLEHETIRLLLEEGSNVRTEIAKSISVQYAEIMVDEYQDTNGVQEAIFSAISNGKNLFMVGDVKQSIYSFRLAEPEIFLRNYNAFKDYSEAEAGEGRKVLLNKNFRSRSEILAAVNDVMRICMSTEVGGLDYTEAEALVPGRTDFIELDTAAVELCTINMDERAVDADDAEETVAKADVEARYVAKRIQSMLASELIQDEETGEMRKVSPKDIAILMRSTRSSAKYYVKALNELGIPSTTARNGSILDTTEVATLYAFLQVVDNPMQDIPLVAVLASPLCGFDADTLADVRIKNKGAANFYEAICKYAEENEKAAEFCAHLDALRSMKPYTKLSRLFSEILERTAADDVFGSMSNGDLRMANIHKFNEMISAYEAGGAHGLFEFLCHIESLRAQGVELPQASSVSADEAVTIMSIHASKGLEFPVVFLADMSRRFNTSDLKASALLHKELGAGVQVMDKEHMRRYPTVARSAISMAIAAEAKSEELRILYVGMTRAKQRLIMTYCDKLSRTLARLAGEAGANLAPAASQAVTNPGEWVLLTALAKPDADSLFRLSGSITADVDETPSAWELHHISAADVTDTTKSTMEELEADESMMDDDLLISEDDIYDAPDIDEIEKNLNFEYAHEAAIHTPSKTVATSLVNRGAKVTIRRPDFAQAKKGFTAAERGTATHLFMRYADYSCCVEEGLAGIHNEVSRICAKGFISEHDSKAIMVNTLHTLFSSDVGKELAHLNNAKREFPFTLTLPAKELYGEDAPDDLIVFEGIVDLHCITDEGIVIYDFKTDYVADEAEELLKAKSYKAQVALYAKALEIIYGMPVVKREIVFLRTGHGIAV